MANFSAAQKREHAVLTKIQTELEYFANKQVMTVASSVNSNVPLAFNLDAFQIIDGDIDFAPESYQSQSEISPSCSTAVQDYAPENAGPDSLEWFSSLLQNAARAS